jgi:hypothetical protein
MNFRLAILTALLLSACASRQQLPSTPDLARTVAALNADLARYAATNSLSSSRIDMSQSCRAILVTQWSKEASARKGFASAETRTPIDFASIKSIDYVEARTVAKDGGLQRWDEGIRITFLGNGVRVDTKAVLAGSFQEVSGDFETDFAEISTTSGSTTPTSDVASLVAQLRNVGATCTETEKR